MEKATRAGLPINSVLSSSHYAELGSSNETKRGPTYAQNSAVECTAYISLWLIAQVERPIGSIPRPWPDAAVPEPIRPRTPSV